MDIAPVLIDGKWRSTQGIFTFHANNPVTGEALPLGFPISDWDDCDAALTAAADAAATATAATPAAPASSAASAAATPAAAATGFLDEATKRSRVLLVEDIERGETDVGDFLVTERDSVARRHVRRLRHVRYRGDCCGCAAHQ